MRKKTIIFMLVLALAVMAFTPMAMADTIKATEVNKAETTMVGDLVVAKGSSIISNESQTRTAIIPYTEAVRLVCLRVLPEGGHPAVVRHALIPNGEHIILIDSEFESIMEVATLLLKYPEIAPNSYWPWYEQHIAKYGGLNW
jgi:hypothetical protein